MPRVTNIVPFRLSTRLDIRPRSLLFYAHRSEFAARFFQKTYAHWELDSNQIRLIDHATEKRMIVTSGSIGFDVDRLDNLASVVRHIGAATRSYMDVMLGDSVATRFGMLISFLSVGESFDDLYPRFSRNVLPMEKPWYALEHFDVRDVGVNLYYGTQRNGLNLQTPSQAESFAGRTNFNRERELPDILRGALLIALDRYVAEVRDHKDVVRVLDQCSELQAIAERLVARTMTDAEGES